MVLAAMKKGAALRHFYAKVGMRIKDAIACGKLRYTPPSSKTTAPSLFTLC